MESKKRCPKCGSEKLITNNREISDKMLNGAILNGGIGFLGGLGGVGLLGGFYDRNKMMTTCLSCGHEFDPINNKYSIWYLFSIIVIFIFIFFVLALI